MSASFLRFLLINLMCGLSLQLNAQYASNSARLSLGGGITTEYAIGGADSDIYYNEISPLRQEGSLFVREMNLQGRFNIDRHFSLHTRLQLRRRFGMQLEQLRLIQATLRWETSNRKIRLEAGRFLNAFGNFFQRPLPQDRDLITSPLPYSYYLNISDRFGYSPGLQGLPAVFADSIPDWGSPLAYPDGYATGLQARWAPKPDTLELTVALTQAAPMSARNRSQPIHPTLNTHLHWQPTYFWQQGFSLSYGGFLQSVPVNSTLDRLGQYRQLLLGTDFKLGRGYWELKGEVISGWHKVPVFDTENQAFTHTGSEAPWLHMWAGYVDVKTEFPFLVGAYAIYRLGWLRPSSLNEAIGGLTEWEDNMTRHTLGIGYEFSRILLLKTAYAWQLTPGRDWDFNHWRTSLTVYF